MIVSQAVTADSVNSCGLFARTNRLKLGCSEVDESATRVQDTIERGLRVTHSPMAAQSGAKACRGGWQRVPGSEQPELDLYKVPGLRSRGVVTGDGSNPRKTAGWNDGTQSRSHASQHRRQGRRFPYGRG